MIALPTHNDLKGTAFSFLYASLLVYALLVAAKAVAAVAFLMAAMSSSRTGQVISAFKERKNKNGFGHFKEPQSDHTTW